jgi:hypothetical protein
MKYKRRAVGLRITIPLHIGVGYGIGVAPDEPSAVTTVRSQRFEPVGFENRCGSR